MSSSTAALPKRSPGDFLKSVVGKPVSVKLTSGADCKGILVCLDPYMNIALEQAEEWENGSLVQKYGDCFLRGNNVLYVSTLKRK
jgi:U6 snRNA-associated Sm-like protein LSm6